MERKEIEALLQGLPETEGRILAAVEVLERQQLASTARDLLERALEAGAGPRLRVELCKRLADRGRSLAALKHLEPVDDPRLASEVALIRALAHHELGRFDAVEEQLQYARATGVAEDELAAWRAHFEQGAPRPPYPQAFGNSQAGSEFARPEPTHLIDLDDPSSWDGGSADAQTQLRDSLPSGHDTLSDAVTHVRPRLKESQLSAREQAIAEERTVLTSFPSDALDPPLRADDSPTRLRIKAPILPDPADLAVEMPRYMTGRSSMESAAQPGPYDDIHTGPELDFPEPDLPEPDLPQLDFPEPDLPELDLPKKTRRPRPEPAAEPRDDGNSYGSVRQLTVYFRDRGHTRLAELLQSPVRALFIASLTALLFLAAGISIIYSAIGNAHIKGELSAVETAINADLYSSHLAALRDLNTLSEYRVLSAEAIDTPLRRATAWLPFLGIDGRLDRAADLQVFVRARLNYRFEHPGALTMDELPEATTALTSAAHAYLQLATGDKKSALATVDSHLLNALDNPFVALAMADIIVGAEDLHRVRMLVESSPQDFAASVYLHAQMLLLLEDERATSYITEAAQGLAAGHVGMQLALASVEEDPEKARQILAPLVDTGHPHASPVERGQAFLQRAELHRLLDEVDDFRRELQQAAESAPLHPAMVRPLIDEWLRTGELLEARAHLSRLPSTEGRHHYFDLAMARIDQLLGDIEGAAARLEPHAFGDDEATARQGVLSALLNDRDRALALIDAVSDSPQGKIADTWLSVAIAATGPDDEEALLDDLAELEELAVESLTPYFQALRAEIFRLSAGLASSRSERQQLLRRAYDALPDDGSESPETRHAACQIALDLRDQADSQRHCALLVSHDGASFQATLAAMRWHHYQRDMKAADDALKAHISLIGPSPSTEIVTARQQLLAHDLDGARQTLDDLPSTAHQLPDRSIVEGYFALRTGRNEIAADHFRHAQRASLLHRPEAALGLAEARGYVDDSTGDDERETAIRSTLRNGQFAPRAWTLFASLRRQQNRIPDARENLGFAKRALSDFSSLDEEVFYRIEELALEQHRRGAGHRSISPLLNTLEELNADHWRYHLLAARWHRSQRRPNVSSVRRHLRAALQAAPSYCPIWDEADAITNARQRRSVTSAISRPEEC